MRTGLLVKLGALLLVLALGLGACGGDDGAGVRDLGGSASGSGSGSASGSASGTGSASGSGSSSAVAECEPVGDSSTADATVAVTLDEWSVSPESESAESESAAAGAVTFEVANEGEHAHELVVVRADDVASLPLGDEETVVEEGLESGAFIGEVEAFPPGESCEGTFDLEPANYVLFCNIAEQEHGEIENHFQNGMATEFTVE
ncbi:MAG: hypothetical protein ACRDKF_16770 [Actinomycetota bacterium]